VFFFFFFHVGVAGNRREEGQKKEKLQAAASSILVSSTTCTFTYTNLNQQLHIPIISRFLFSCQLPPLPFGFPFSCPLFLFFLSILSFPFSFLFIWILMLYFCPSNSLLISLYSDSLSLSTIHFVPPLRVNKRGYHGRNCHSFADSLFFFLSVSTSIIFFVFFVHHSLSLNLNSLFDILIRIYIYIYIHILILTYWVYSLSVWNRGNKRFYIDELDGCPRGRRRIKNELER